MRTNSSHTQSHPPLTFTLSAILTPYITAILTITALHTLSPTPGHNSTHPLTDTRSHNLLYTVNTPPFFLTHLHTLTHTHTQSHTPARRRATFVTPVLSEYVSSQSQAS